MRRICDVVAGKPVIIAGSLDRAERIRAAASAGAAGFTVGTAAFDGAFPTSPDLAGQIACIQTILSHT